MHPIPMRRHALRSSGQVIHIPKRRRTISLKAAGVLSRDHHRM
jgi:hypothetical protein